MHAHTITTKTHSLGCTLIFFLGWQPGWLSHCTIPFSSFPPRADTKCSFLSQHLELRGACFILPTELHKHTHSCIRALGPAWVIVSLNTLLGCSICRDSYSKVRDPEMLSHAANTDAENNPGEWGASTRTLLGHSVCFFPGAAHPPMQKKPWPLSWYRSNEKTQSKEQGEYKNIDWMGSGLFSQPLICTLGRNGRRMKKQRRDTFLSARDCVGKKVTTQRSLWYLMRLCFHKPVNQYR